MAWNFTSPALTVSFFLACVITVEALVRVMPFLVTLTERLDSTAPETILSASVALPRNRPLPCSNAPQNGPAEVPTQVFLALQKYASCFELTWAVFLPTRMTSAVSEAMVSPLAASKCASPWSQPISIFLYPLHETYEPTTPANRIPFMVASPTPLTPAHKAVLMLALLSPKKAACPPAAPPRSASASILISPFGASSALTSFLNSTQVL